MVKGSVNQSASIKKAVGLILWLAVFTCYFYVNQAFLGCWSHISWAMPDLTLLQFSAFLRHAGSFCIFLWLAILGVSIGVIALEKLGLKFHNMAEHLCLSLGLGWGLLGLLMLLLGLMKLWYIEPILTFLAAATPLAIFWAWRLRPLQGQKRIPWDRTDKFLFGILVAIASLNAFGCFMPAVFYDALVYHFALPAFYWMHHAVVPTPYNFFSGMPMLGEMLFSLGLAAKSTSAAHLVNWACGICSALLMLGLSARLSGRWRVGLLAALIFYSTPLVGVLSWKGAIDLLLVFYQLAAIYAVAVRFHEPSAANRWTLLAGIFTGLAMGTKYTAWPLLPILSVILFLFLGSSKAERGERWKESAIFIAAALMVAALWPIKDILLYRNPVYPFLAGFFKPLGPHPNWKRLLYDEGSPNFKRILTTWAGFKAFLGQQPWLIPPRKQWDTTCLGGLFLIGLPIFILSRFREPGYRIIYWSLILFWLDWSLTTTTPRFFLPAIPLAAILFAAGCELNFKNNIKSIAYAAVIFAVCSNALWTMFWLKRYDANGVILGLEPTQSWLSDPHTSYGSPSYPAMEFINTKLPKDSRIMFVDEPQGFYCRRDYQASTVYDENPFLEMIRQSRTGDELFQKLRKAGFTDMMFNFARIASDHGPFQEPMTKAETHVYLNFAGHHLKQIFLVKRAFPAVPGAKTYDATWCGVFSITG